MSMTFVIVLAVVGTIVLVGMLVAGVAGEAREQANGEATATTGKASHLERVRTAEFSAKPLLNGSERREPRTCSSSSTSWAFATGLSLRCRSACRK